MSTAVDIALAMRARRAAIEAKSAAEATLRIARAAFAESQTPEKGEKGDKPDHEWIGTGLRFEKPDGSWGPLVDLRGPKGGSSSGGGSGIGVLTPLPQPVLNTDFLVVQRGGRLYRVSIAALKYVFGAAPLPEGVLLTESGDALITESGDYLVKE